MLNICFISGGKGRHLGDWDWESRDGERRVGEEGCCSHRLRHQPCSRWVWRKKLNVNAQFFQNELLITLIVQYRKSQCLFSIKTCIIGLLSVASENICPILRRLEVRFCSVLENRHVWNVTKVHKNILGVLGNAQLGRNAKCLFLCLFP